MWIGLCKSDESSAWKWLGGTPFVYNNFNGQPSGTDGYGRKELCVHSYPGGSAAGKWNDIVCDQEYVYAALCSMPANLAG
ncbi:collectin-12 [Aphelenchoides avenae]|nr:collectin-12 [Aphelenchus avenae]